MSPEKPAFIKQLSVTLLLSLPLGLLLVNNEKTVKALDELRFLTVKEHVLVGRSGWGCLGQGWGVTTVGLLPGPTPNSRECSYLRLGEERALAEARAHQSLALGVSMPTCPLPMTPPGDPATFQCV